MNVPSEQPIPPGNSASRLLRDRRLVQAVWAACIAIVASAIPDILSERWRNLPPLFVGLAAMSLVLLLVRAGRRTSALTLMLISLTGMVGLLMWQNGGLRDSSLLTFPCLLVFAAMMGARRLYFVLFVAMTGAVTLVLVGNLQGWHVNRVPTVSVNTLVDVVAVLCVTTVIAWLMSNDMHNALDAVHAQNLQMAATQARMELMATHDALTGLPNRSLARDRFEQAAAIARRAGHGVAMLYLDLDNFKNVNDTLGHSSGDNLLRQVSDRLSALLRTADTVARLGGDEFLLLVPEVIDVDGVGDLASKVVTSLMAPFDVMGMEIFAGCSLGVTMFPTDGEDFDSLLKKADIAMYRAKEMGNNNYQFYTAAMNERALERLRIEGDLRNAMERKELLLYYQPQVDLRTGRMVGMEALIRWKHPQLGMISPTRFIDLAEETGLIVQMGAWVMHTACEQNKAWQRMGLGYLRMSVNLSTRQFFQQNLVRQVAKVLDETGLAPHYLEIELTESLVMTDVELAVGILNDLKSIGVQLSIDDFGTGYSSLAYLKSFPIDALKIDQSFVRDITVDQDDAAIVASIISLAHNLRLQVIAEGVETQQQLSYLQRHRCDEMQGFYFSEPVSADDIEVILREGKVLP